MKVHLLLVPALAFAVAMVVAEYEPAVSPAVPPPAVPVPVHPLPPPQPESVLPIQPFVPYQVIEEQDGDDAGFVVQNGFEGYIMPENINLLEPGKTEGGNAVLPVLGLLGGLMKLPKLLLGLFPIFGNFVMLLLTGGAVATAVCAFTPLCTLPLPFRMDTVKSYMDSDRAKFGLGFILDAIEYYEKWYHREEEMKKGETNEVKRVKKRR